MSLTLYHYQNSVCSQKVRLALAEKGLAFESAHVNLMTFENLADDYLALNPDGVVPTLVDDGTVIRESSVIIEYLDDRYPEPALKPAAAADRAAMRLLIRLEDETGLEAVGVHTMELFIKPMMASLSEEALDEMGKKHPKADRAAIHDLVARGGSIPQEVLDKATRDLTAALDTLEQALEGRAFLAGESYSLADATWVPFLRRMELLGMAGLFAPEARPRVANWYAACQQRPSFKDAIEWWEQNPVT